MSDSSLLRFDENERYTPDSLREHFREQVVRLGKPEQIHYAFGVLYGLATGQGWTKDQVIAVAEGLESGLSVGRIPHPTEEKA